MGDGPLPVLVFELPRSVPMRMPDGRTLEAQTEAIIQGGFGRFLPSATPPRLPGWSLRRTLAGIELWDQGGIWARVSLSITEAWLNAATGSEVLVLYGPRTGVGLPAKVDAQDHTNTARDAELLASRKAGVVAAARIPWNTKATITSHEAHEALTHPPSPSPLLTRLGRLLRPRRAIPPQDRVD